MTIKKEDAIFMNEAIKEARKAVRSGEVPVGAVIVNKDGIIARGHNKKEAGNDPTSHAEISAIRSAARKLKTWRLTGGTLYVTLEPCLMCMGAMIQARIPRLVFAAFDPKAGACGSLYDISRDTRLNHRMHVTSGVGREASEELLKSFFSAMRSRKKIPGRTFL